MAGGEVQIHKERPAQVVEAEKSSETIFKTMVIERTKELIYEMGGGVGDREKRKAFIQAMTEIKKQLGMA